MTVCRELFEAAEAHARNYYDAPIRLFPCCHPKAYMEVFMDGKKKEVLLTCSQCDSVVARIKVKHLIEPPHGNKRQSDKGPQAKS